MLYGLNYLLEFMVDFVHYQILSTFVSKTKGYDFH